MKLCKLKEILSIIGFPLFAFCLIITVAIISFIQNMHANKICEGEAHSIITDKNGHEYILCYKGDELYLRREK